jgi:hypothetical protein
METLKMLFVEFKDTEEEKIDQDEVVIEFIKIILDKFDIGDVFLINPLEPS